MFDYYLADKRREAKMNFTVFTAINTVLCLIAFVLILIVYRQEPPKKHFLKKLRNKIYIPEMLWLIPFWWVCMTLTYLFYEIGIMALFAIFNTILCFVAAIITTIILRNHKKEIARRIPLIIIAYWCLITVLLIGTGIFTKLGLLSEMLIVVLQIAGYLALLGLGWTIFVLILLALAALSFEAAANVQQKTY